MPFRGESVYFDAGGPFLPLAGGDMSGDIGVTANNTYNLGNGAGTGYWANVFAANLDVAAALTIGTSEATQIDIGRFAAPCTVHSGTITLGAAAGGGTVRIYGSPTLGEAATTTTIEGTLRYDNNPGGATSAGVLATPTNARGSLLINVDGVEQRVLYYDP